LPRKRKARVARKRRSLLGRRRFPVLDGTHRGEVSALVVGLGNPGSEHSGTRHNAGRDAATRLLEDLRILEDGKWSQGRLTAAAADPDPVKLLVLLPDTFMNNSGYAVEPVLRQFGLTPDRMVVIHDDIDIPLGEVRLKSGGGAGGHRGLTSIVREVGAEDFHRVRIGVGRPPPGIDAADFVLSRFSPEEEEAARDAIRSAAEAALSLVKGDR